MNYFILISIVVCLCACGSPAQEERTTENEKQEVVPQKEETPLPPSNTEKSKAIALAGTINSKYQVRMRLVYEEAPKVCGYYFYNSSGADMQLDGVEKAGDLLVLKEYNSKKKHTGTFEGTLKNGKFEGIWTKADGTKSFPFLLQRVANNHNCKSITVKNATHKYENEEHIDVVFPAFSGDDEVIVKRLTKRFSLQNISGQSMEEIDADLKEFKERGVIGGLSELSYSVVTNSNCILCINVYNVYVGAHLSGYSSYYNVDLRTGLDIHIADIIKNDKLKELAELCDSKLQKIISEILKDPEIKKEADIVAMIKDQKFEEHHLDLFYITNNQLQFAYNFDFPHVYKAFEPDGTISFSSDEIKSYIKTDGLLTF